MPIEHINKTDTLNEGREKLNAAIDGANAADVTSQEADTKATQALSNSESTQTQLDTIVIEGDSSVEAAQARVDEKGESHATLKARIDDGMNSVNTQLAQTEETIGNPHDFRYNDPNLITKMRNEFGDRGYNVSWNALLALDGDWAEAIQTAIDSREENESVLIPPGNFRTTKEIYVNKRIDFICLGQIDVDHDGNGIVFDEVGRGDGNTPHFRIKIKKLNRKHDVDNAGLVLKNSYHCKVEVDYIENFTTNLLLTSGEGKGTVYNEISIGQIKNGKTQIHIHNYDNRGWTNQNTFTAGRLYYSRLENRDGYVQIKIDDELYNNNGNVFTNTSIEDVGVNGEFAMGVIIGGHHNVFSSPRTEGSLEWLFTETSFRNKLEGGVYVSMNRVTDLSGDNDIIPQGTGLYRSIQGGSNKYVATANNSTAIEAVATNPGARALVGQNTSSNGAPVFVGRNTNGKDVIQVRANGIWNVNDGRKVYWGVYSGIPPVNNAMAGDISFVSNPGSNRPSFYVCTSGDGTDGGIWRPQGGPMTSQPDSTATELEQLKNDFNQLLGKLKSSGHMFEL